MKITKKEIKDIIQFKSNMIKILKESKNEAKKSWKELSIYDLYKYLGYNYEELDDFFQADDYDNIMRTCIDIANFAFMIYDNAKNEKIFFEKIIENHKKYGLKELNK